MNLQQITKSTQNNEKLTDEAVDKSLKEFSRIDVKKALKDPKKYLEEFIKRQVKPLLIKTTEQGFAQGKKNAKD